MTSFINHGRTRQHLWLAGHLQRMLIACAIARIVAQLAGTLVCNIGKFTADRLKRGVVL